MSFSYLVRSWYNTSKALFGDPSPHRTLLGDPRIQASSSKRVWRRAFRRAAVDHCVPAVEFPKLVRQLGYRGIDRAVRPGGLSFEQKPKGLVSVRGLVGWCGDRTGLVSLRIMRISAATDKFLMTFKSSQNANPYVFQGFRSSGFGVESFRSCRVTHILFSSYLEKQRPILMSLRRC